VIAVFEQGGSFVIGYLSDIWRLRYFWMALVRIDLQSRYRRSVIGVGWSLLHPIAMTVVLCVVFSTLFQENVPTYAPYLLTGLTYWGFLVAVVMQGCHCFFQGESYIRQQPAPLAIYSLRTTLGAGFHFLLGLMIAMVFVWYVNGFSNLLSLLSLIPSLVLLFVIGWSLATCMGVMNVMFQDSQHLVEVAMQVLFYATPIFYRADRLENAYIAKFVQFNPLAILLNLIRQPLLYGQIPSQHDVISGMICGLLAVVAASATLACFEKKMIFYL
jgi:lipopolysaccharide transport system permease protein